MFDTQLNLKLKMGSPKVPEMNGNPEVRGCVSQGQRVYRDWGIYLLCVVPCMGTLVMVTVCFQTQWTFKGIRTIVSSL